MLQQMITYKDEYDRDTALTSDEAKWFCDVVEKAKRATGYGDINIIAYDHDKIPGHENALGICHTNNYENPIAFDADTQITIDCWYIHLCYNALFNGGYSFDGPIEETLAHELAHLTYWRHGRWHQRQTKRLLHKIAPEQMTE